MLIDAADLTAHSEASLAPRPPKSQQQQQQQRDHSSRQLYSQNDASDSDDPEVVSGPEPGHQRPNLQQQQEQQQGRTSHRQHPPQSHQPPRNLGGVDGTSLQGPVSSVSPVPTRRSRAPDGGDEFQPEGDVLISSSSVGAAPGGHLTHPRIYGHRHGLAQSRTSRCVCAPCR